MAVKASPAARIARPWPGLGDYHQLMTNPRQWLKDERLHGMQVECRPGTRDPKPRSGNFGAVYKFVGARDACALKVFTRSDPERDLRYRLIDGWLRQRSVAGLVAFRYAPQGILCNGLWWPTLLMDWVEGQRLDLYLNRLFETGGELENGAMCQRWATLLKGLAAAEVAHGDLQQGNVLVLPEGAFMLVDYDGMYVPPMSAQRLGAPEFGLPAFQHPKRRAGAKYYDARLDDFSALVVLTTLACLNGDLWRRYNRGDDQCLIFRERDFCAPEQSPLFQELLAHAAPPVRKLARLLINAAQGALDQIPRFSKVLADAAVAQVLDPSWRARQVKAVRRGPSCTKCGAALRAKDLYCPNCAEPVRGKTLPAPPTPRVQVTPAPTPMPPPPPPKPKFTWRDWLISGGVIIAILSRCHPSHRNSPAPAPAPPPPVSQSAGNAPTSGGCDPYGPQLGPGPCS